jgi:ABC-type multidrug transport system permease subunit
LLSLIAARYFFLQEYRENFQGLAARIGFVLSLALELLVFKLTAITFGLHIEGLSELKGDYFQFVVVGELAILLPATCAGVFLAGVREAKGSGLFELLCAYPGPRYRMFFHLAFGGLARALLHAVVFLLLAIGLFGFRLSILQALWLLAVQALALPLFCALGLMAAAVFLRYGRGASAFDLFLRAGMIFSGVYFPTSVYPVWLARLGIYFSPFNAIVELGRWKPAADSLPIGALLSLALWSLLSLSLCSLVLQSAFVALRRRGSVDVDFSAT